MGRKNKTLVAKPCSRCEARCDRLLRSRLGEGKPWLMLCERCWVRLARDNPEYTYGGEWRAKKRRG